MGATESRAQQQQPQIIVIDSSAIARPNTSPPRGQSVVVLPGNGTSLMNQKLDYGGDNEAPEYFEQRTIEEVSNQTGPGGNRVTKTTTIRIKK